jgi:hypothetical protein
VSQYTLDEESLKSRFKQIVGFYYVSSYTQQGLKELEKKIVEVTLLEKYMGEKIPVNSSVTIKFFQTSIKI